MHRPQAGLMGRAVEGSWARLQWIHGIGLGFLCEAALLRIFRAHFREATRNVPMSWTPVDLVARVCGVCANSKLNWFSVSTSLSLPEHASSSRRLHYRNPSNVPSTASPACKNSRLLYAMVSIFALGRHEKPKPRNPSCRHGPRRVTRVVHWSSTFRGSLPGDQEMTNQLYR